MSKLVDDAVRYIINNGSTYPEIDRVALEGISVAITEVEFDDHQLSWDDYSRPSGIITTSTVVALIGGSKYVFRIEHSFAQIIGLLTSEPGRADKINCFMSGAGHTWDDPVVQR